MPAPTNISALTATALGTLPATATQNVHDAGTTYTVWYSFAAPADANVIGAWGFGDLTGYFPTIRAYVGPAAAPVQVLAIAGENRPIQFPVTGGVTYYLEFTTNSPTVTPASLAISVLAAPTDAAVDGDYVVLADELGHPSIVIPPTTDFSVRRFVTDFIFDSSASSAANLANGTMIVVDEDANALRVYDRDFALLASPAVVLTTTPVVSANRASNTFYVTGSAVPAVINMVSATGVVSGTSYSVTGATMYAICASNDGTILYYGPASGFGPGSPVQRWNLITDSALADFAAAVPGYIIYDILAMSDGTILVGYASLGAVVARDFYVLRYNPDGTVAQTYSFGGDFGSAVPRIAYGSDYETTFAVWAHEAADVLEAHWYSVFLLVQLSDGAVLSTKFGAEYDELDGDPTQDGVYAYDMTATPVARFGNANSCPFLVMTSASSAPLSITGITEMNCERPIVQRLTITGTGFDINAVVTGTDPLGEPLDIVVSEITSTSISLTFSSIQYGSFCFTVTNPDNVTQTLCIPSTSCTDPVVMRRLRRGAHIVSDGKKWLRHSSFNLDYEAGVGLNSGQGSDPEFLLRWSDDGGHQWSDWHPIKIGKMGKYTHRAIWRRLGRSRDRVYELGCSDPVKVAWLDAYLEIEEGTS